MNIFISNDDGVNSNGLLSLSKRLANKHNVLVVAPDGNRSACSHSLTISKTIKINKISDNNFPIYSISGSPADCVKVGKLIFSDFDTNLVVAGINKGHNIGSDIMYSGTLAIACEGSFFGHVSFAFSAFSLGESDFDEFAKHAEKIIDTLLPLSEKGDIWNINFPNVDADKIKGIKLTKLGKHLYTDEYVKVGENEYLLTGEPLINDEYTDCDVWWINKGYITVTPILFNKTNYEKLNKIKSCIKL